jgi:Flp pilus assembly protein TadD
MGRHADGVAELERAVALDPGNTLFLAQLGQALADVGRVADARAVLRQLEQLATQRDVSPYHLAYVYVGLGEQDAALDALERAFDQRAGAIYGIRSSFLFTPLHSHPRFTALLKKMNLGPATVP